MFRHAHPLSPQGICWAVTNQAFENGMLRKVVLGFASYLGFSVKA
jgi:hypothetical protein